MAAPHLPPITRASLKELYGKNAIDPIPKDLQDSLPKLVAALDAAKKKLGDKIPPRATREEEAPKRIDENLWRMREEAEILEETVAQLLPKLQANSNTHTAMSSLLNSAKSVSTEITNYQQTLVAETLKRVESFLPQDFRLSMIRYTKERKETAFKGEVDELVKKGGSIEDKYKLLWAQQMQRRESLVQLSNASGMWKALISYVAGCPPELLDFLKQFNDPQGPMEEFRLAYGPNVYFLTRYIGRLRAALVATAASDQLAEHEKLMQHGGEEVAKEVKKTMAFLLVINVKKSPFFVDAEEDSDAPKEHTVAAWAAFEKHRPVHKGAKITWEFTTKSGDIGFAVAFTSATGEVLALKRYNADKEAVKGEHTSPADGTYQFKWDNTYSWTTSKTLNYRVQVQGGQPSSPVVPPASP